MLGENFPTTVVHVDTHISGTFANSDTQARGTFYGASSAPDVRSDGKYADIGAWNPLTCTPTPTSYSHYLDRYNTRMTETGGVSPVSIEGVWSIAGNTGTAQITITLVDPVALGAVQATIWVAENDVYYNASTSFNYLSRVVKSEAVTGLVNQGDQVTVTKTFAINAAWEQDQLWCCAALQKTTGDKAIYQGAVIPYLVDFSVNIPEKVASVPAGNGDAFFYGTIQNDTSSPDVMTVSLDAGFGAWSVAFQLEGDPTWYTDPTQLNLAGMEGKQVTIRVSTDAAHEIRSGNVRVQSQNTNRLQATALRVFNDSYAVMFVDDDGTRTDETPWITTLNGMGLLYDNWQTVINGNNGPGIGTLAGFDVLVWQHGYWLTNLLTTADTTAIKEYLDLGGAFVLNSMDFMNTQTSQRTFIRDYLGVSSWTAGVGGVNAIGVAGDPISDGMNVPLTFTPGTNRVDRIDPIPTGTTYFSNESSLSTGVHQEFGRASRVAFFTAPVNAMPASGTAPNTQDAVIQRHLIWALNAFDPADASDLPPLAGRLAVSPNPAFGHAELRFSVSPRSAAEPVELTVVDASGRRVRSLANGSMEVGDHRLSWDGRDDSGRLAPSGVYFAKLHTIDGTNTQKLVLAR